MASAELTAKSAAEQLRKLADEIESKGTNIRAFVKHHTRDVTAYGGAVVVDAEYLGTTWVLTTMHVDESVIIRAVERGTCD